MGQVYEAKRFIDKVTSDDNLVDMTICDYASDDIIEFATVKQLVDPIKSINEQIISTQSSMDYDALLACITEHSPVPVPSLGTVDSCDAGVERLVLHFHNQVLDALPTTKQTRQDE